MKCRGEQDRDTQVASDAVRGCGPLRRLVASEREAERRRSCAARKVAVLEMGEGGGDAESGGGGKVCVRVRARSSIEWLRRAWRVVSGARRIGLVAAMVWVCQERVRRRRVRVYVGKVGVSYSVYEEESCMAGDERHTPLTILVPWRVI